MSWTLYHNPNCGTSRTVLATLREAGIEPEVVLYLKTPPDIAQLRALRDALGQPAQALLRTKEPLCAELGLDQEGVDEERILVAIAEHPILLNRPVVSSPRGARVCRPAEVVKELLG
ncbi:MAG: arsenate reductase (glutaredoxin) [Lysobacteraceae bacterium]